MGDAVTVYRENLLDRALCMSMDCFNNVATTVFAKNGTKSDLCFQRRFNTDPDDKVVLDVNTTKLQEYLRYHTDLQRKEWKFNGHYTDAYKSEQLVLFETSESEQDFVTSYDSWISLLTSLGVQPNKRLVFEVLSDYRGKKSHKTKTASGNNTQLQGSSEIVSQETQGSVG